MDHERNAHRVSSLFGSLFLSLCLCIPLLNLVILDWFVGVSVESGLLKDGYEDYWGRVHLHPGRKGKV